MSKETFLYSEINIACIIILVIYLSNLVGNMTCDVKRRESKKELFKLVVYTIITCFGDLVYGIAKGDFFTGSSFVLYASCLLYLAGFVMIAFSWMRYITVIMEYKPVNYKLYKFVRKAPIAVFAAAVALEPFTDVFFTINEQNIYQRSNGIIIHWLVMWFYLLYTVMIEFKTIMHRRKNINNQLYLPFVYFIIPPIITGILQMFSSNIACYQVGITISIVLIFIADQNYEMSIDSLTGIENRHSLEKLKAQFFRHPTGVEFAFFMIDLNDFKQVNDRYGHATGDYMLERTAQLLKQVCQTIEGKTFIGRYGGDEFIVIARNEDNIKESFVNSLETLFEQENKLGKGGYLSASIGFAHGQCRCEEDYEELMRRADESMYFTKALGKNGILEA